MDFTVRIISRNLATTSNSEIVGISHFLRQWVSGAVKRLVKDMRCEKVTYYMYSCDTCCMISERIR